MGIRQTLNENPAFTTGLTAAIILVALVAIIYQAVKKPPVPKAPTEAYYSDDDGKSWFLDDINKVPPFDHNGKEAYRAVLIRCGSNKPFVWRIEGYDPAERAQLEEMMKSGAANRFAGLLNGMKVKKPGEKRWVKFQADNQQAAEEYSKLMVPRCPDGEGDIHIVTVDEKAEP